MCGIAGIYNPRKRDQISLETLKRMTVLLSHRGPDESGIYLDDQVGLGHSRLSIIDLSSGLQPIHNENKKIWIIANGEFYNYLELRDQLGQKGHRFYTSSDTEVVLHLYEEKGAAALEDLNGQFAFAIWDTRKKELFLARDRMGIRPLHYIQKDSSLLFASEIKSLFACRNISREIDPTAIDQIFTFWTTLPGKSVFKGIQELPPGHYLRARNGRVIVKKYWEIPLYPREEQWDLPPQRICQGIQDLLRDAVRIRLRADVPVGCYLSGGLDSSIVATLTAQGHDNNLQTFGIRFEEAAFDEGRYQEDMVSFLGTAHSELHATNTGIGTSFPEVVWHCEKPLLRTAPVPLFLLSGLVRQNNLKVVLTGEGADEVFGGYNIFKEVKIRRFWSRYPNSSARAALVKRLYPYIFKRPRLEPFLQSFFRRNLDRTEDPLFSHLVRWENTSKIKTFFSGQLKDMLHLYDPYRELRENLPSSYSRWDSLTKAQYLEMAIFLSNYLLSSQGDRVAMAHSVEIRLPYLDHRVLEFMGRIASRWKMLGLKEKYILKKSFDGVMPDHVVRRAKHPYRAPIKESLLNTRTTEYTLEMLSERALNRTGLFDADRVTRLLRKLEVAEYPSEIDSMALAGILSTQLIHHQFISDFSARPGRSVSPDLVIDRRFGA